MPVCVIFLYVFSFSVLFTLKPFQTESYTYVNIVIPSYFLLILYIIFIVLSEFTIIPKLKKDIAVAEYRSKIAHRALKHADAMLTENENEEALSALNILLKIDSNNKEGLKLKEKATKRLSEPLSGAALTAEEATAGTDESSANYLEIGKAEYEQGRYYSALFYLERALQLHKNNAELQELYKRSKTKAENSFAQLTKDEEKKRKFIQDKTRAIEHLNNNEYYEAYEIFSYLSKNYPELKDINLYLKEVTDELLIRDFLPAEIKPLVWLPSMDDLVFIDKEGYINTIERAIAFQNNFYFINIRRYKDNRQIASEKYGKWINDSIRLKNDEGFTKPSRQEDEQHNIHPFISPSYLIYFGNSETLAGMLNIYERITFTDNLLNSGLNIVSNMMYLSQKIGIFSAVYILTLFLSALAWSKRSVYTTPPKLKLILFVVIVPFLVYFLYLFYLNVNNVIIYTHNYFTRFLIKNMNIAVYTGLINLGISFVVTIFFLSQRKTA
jgi:tetratricopeptide (TPR) repeat protein